jgi:periplasmic protein TonB
VRVLLCQPPTVNCHPSTVVCHRIIYGIFLIQHLKLTAQVLMLIHSSNKTDYMEPIDMLSADPLDILFENRNKAYGAYPLRKYYAQRLYISMAVTLSVVVMSIFFYLSFNNNPTIKMMNHFPDTYLTPVDLTQPEKPILPPVKPSIPRAPVATVTETPPLIIHDMKPIPPIATVEDLKGADIGVKTLAGGSENGGIQNNGNSKGTNIPAAAPVATKPEIFERAEVMPEFPGGIEALKRYLARNLHMPESNLEPGSTVHIIARFVVGEDGKVRDIEIIREADAVFNTEVKRVISKMPDWKPGSQNHRNVAVYFNLPVNFVSAE